MDSLALLDEDGLSSWGLEVFGEDSSAFGDDRGSFVVLEDLQFEFGVLFSSLVVEFDNIGFKAVEFLGLGADDTSEDFSSGVEITFEFSFESDSLRVTVGEVLVVS